MKPRNKYLFLFLTICFIGVMAYYVVLDLTRDLEQLIRNLENVPPIIVENLEFEREVSGDLWRMWTPRAERRPDVVELHTVDVHRRFANGREWAFTGLHGFYFEAAEAADVTYVSGTMETETRILNLESPLLKWTMEGNVFLFPEGVLVYDDEFTLETDLARLDESGIMEFDEGAVIRWRRLEGGE